MLGRKKKGEPAAFTIVERLTGYYFTIRIQEKTTRGVADAMRQLPHEFGSQFSQVFRTITIDDEFAGFSEMEAYGAQVFLAHPYSAPRNALLMNTVAAILRRFMPPKGKSMSNYIDDQVLMFLDEINAMPRNRLCYRTAEKLF